MVASWVAWKVDHSVDYSAGWRAVQSAAKRADATVDLRAASSVASLAGMKAANWAVQRAV